MHRNLLLTLAGDLVHPSWINISDPILIRTNEFSIFFIQHNNQREILGLQAKSIRCTGHRIFATITNIETNFAFNSLTKIWLRRPLNPSRSNCFTMPRFGEWSCNLGTDVGINPIPIGPFPIMDFHISRLVTPIFSCKVVLRLGFSNYKWPVLQDYNLLICPDNWSKKKGIYIWQHILYRSNWSRVLDD